MTFLFLCFLKFMNCIISGQFQCTGKLSGKHGVPIYSLALPHPSLAARPTLDTCRPWCAGYGGWTCRLAGPSPEARGSPWGSLLGRALCGSRRCGNVCHAVAAFTALCPGAALQLISGLPCPRGFLKLVLTRGYVR